METVKIEVESPKITTAEVSQEVLDTIAKNLKETAKPKRAKKKFTPKPSFNKSKGKRSKKLEVATTSLADVFKALKQD